jgi:hypothetical protein
MSTPCLAELVTDDFSPGARAFQSALTRSGIAVRRSSLIRAARAEGDVLRVDRSLPPYDLPLTGWGGRWWNRPDASWRAWSKQQTAALAAGRLPHPVTVCFESLPADHAADPDCAGALERAEAIWDWTCGTPVIKPDRGLMGDGVERATSVPHLVDLLRAAGRGVAQGFLPQASTTLRVVAAAGQVVYAYSRISAPGDWRGNVAAGATVEPFTVRENDSVWRLAVDALEVFGLDMAGVDIVLTGDGPVLLELNPSFGVAGLLRLDPGAVDRTVAVLLRRR